MDVNGFDLAVINEIKVVDACFCHSFCLVKADIDNSNLDDLLSELKIGVKELCVSFEGDIVFCGKITEIECVKTYLKTSIQVLAKSYSVDMDSDKEKRVYQNPENTYEKIFDFLSDENNKIEIVEDSFLDEKVNMILVQNGETNYEYIKRLCKEHGLHMFEDNTKKSSCTIIIGNKKNKTVNSVSEDQIKICTYKYYKNYEEVSIVLDRIFDVGSNIEIYGTSYLIYSRTIINRFEKIEVEYFLTNQKMENEKKKQSELVSLGLAKVVNNASEDNTGKIQVEFEEYANELSDEKIWIDYITPLTEKAGGLVLIPDIDEYVDVLYSNNQCVAIGCIRRTELAEQIRDVNIRSLLSRNCKLTVDNDDINIDVENNKVQINKDFVTITNEKYELIIKDNQCKIGFEKGHIVIEEEDIQILGGSKLEVLASNVNIKADSAMKIKTSNFDVG